MANYYLYRVGQSVIRNLPLKVGYMLGQCLSDLHFQFSKKDRLSVENNLKVILKQDHVSANEVRAVFRNFGKYLVDFLAMTRRFTPAYMRRKVNIKNIDFLNEVLSKGKGGIIVSAHLGNWELGGAVLSNLGYPISIVALTHKDPKVNAFFNAQREAFGSMVIQTTVSVRHCLSHLKRNRLVCLLVERDFGNHGVVMNFLGRKAKIPKGAALFSLKTGVPIIPCFFIRQPDDSFEIVFHKPIDPPVLVDGKFTEKDLTDLIQVYLTLIEQEIHKQPTQWLMFREFWHQ